MCCRIKPKPHSRTACSKLICQRRSPLRWKLLRKCRSSSSRPMGERNKYPFEVKVASNTLDRGHHWLTVQLRNRSNEPLNDVGATLFTYNSHDIDVLPSGSFHFLKEFHPKDTAALNFHVFANHSGRLYLHVTAYRNGSLVSWYSPDQDLRLKEDPACLLYTSPSPRDGLLS